MGLLDAYQEGTDKVAEVMAARPMDPEPAKPKHSVWSAIPRAVASAGAEVVGNVSDVLDAFGQVSAAAGGLSPGFRPETQKQADQSAEAFQKLKVEGLDFRGEDSQQVYKFARDLRPDPVTAGNAENIVFGLTKGLTKAVGSAAMLGPVGGAFAFGGSEGMTAAEDLAVQGVDKATRTKVGAVTAAMNTAGVLLPVAGNTLAKTATLVAVGGPGSFIAQQAAINHILSSADYGEIAKQFDPLDPMGLIVSTLVPAGFAAYAKRGGFGATVPAHGATLDDVDAAMTHNLTTLQDYRAELDQVTGQRPAEADAVPAVDAPPATVAHDSIDAPAMPKETANDAATLDAFRARVEELTATQPDMVARLDESGQPVRLSDELASIRKAAQEGTDTEFGALDAPLLKVAAECALAIGTAAL